jgi:hypothetical protein
MLEVEIRFDLNHARDCAHRAREMRNARSRVYFGQSGSKARELDYFPFADRPGVFAPRLAP